ncbi:hypothetical protein BKA00_000377 [Actinomadura coerulea]|uniref:Uncharacterized protein n=1 Tax=Actinomadura coerulea TaxID=46159 RepID=A0A7X0FTM0_9ACTN|nr:hypothetical protein [Actinomadura coerulea]MBB6393463.1 hypothetical protein [Actinomadura coerulea]GGP92755.1 hypothetical protein GCM10010187_05260 [Actinomadura coerulea]
MTGDLGSDAGRARSRPSFLPPVDGYPPQHDGPAEAVPSPPAASPHPGGAGWVLALIASASVLLVSAFLPWARAEVVVDLFGRSLSRDLGSVAGIDADDIVLAVPVLAVIAIALAAWDLIGRDARIGALAAVPGVLALLVCGIFVLRLGHVRDDLPRTGLDLGYQITVRFGWYLAVVAALLVVGFSLARPVSDRVSKSQRRPEQDHPRYPSTDQQYAGGQDPEQSPNGEYAAWPSEDQAWGRHDPPHEDASPPEDAPEKDAGGRPRTPEQDPEDAGQS